MEETNRTKEQTERRTEHNKVLRDLTKGILVFFAELLGSEIVTFQIQIQSQIKYNRKSIS